MGLLMKLDGRWFGARLVLFGAVWHTPFGPGWRRPGLVWRTTGLAYAHCRFANLHIPLTWLKMWLLQQKFHHFSGCT